VFHYFIAVDFLIHENGIIDFDVVYGKCVKPLPGVYKLVLHSLILLQSPDHGLKYTCAFLM